MEKERERERKEKGFQNVQKKTKMGSNSNGGSDPFEATLQTGASRNHYPKFKRFEIKVPAKRTEVPRNGLEQRGHFSAPPIPRSQEPNFRKNGLMFAKRTKSAVPKCFAGLLSVW